MIFSQSCPNYFPFLLSSLPLKLHFGHFPYFSSIYVQFSFLFLVFLLRVHCLLDIFLFFLQYMSNFPPFSNHSASHCYQIWIYCHQKCSLCPIHLREYINCALKKNYLETHEFYPHQKENIWKHITSIPIKKIISGNT